MGALQIRDIKRRVKNLENMRNENMHKKSKKLTILTLRDVLKRRKDQNMTKVDQTWLRFQLQGLLNGEESELGPFDFVKDAWKDEPAFVVGGSYGLYNAIKEGFKFEMLDGFHSIGMNHLIEDYDRFEWFIFQDRRFLTNTYYDMKNYKGHIFADIKTYLKPSPNRTIFYTQENTPTDSIYDGLFSFMSTGLLGLHLAIIAGANPIYILGIDNGGKNDSRQGAHYKDDYPHEVKGHKGWKRKYIETIPALCEKYAEYRDRIFNVDPLGDIKIFPKISFRRIPELKEIRKIKELQTTICHVGTLPIEQMGDITRNVFNKTDGSHIYCLLGEKLPEADIYILECFKNRWKEFYDFEKPAGSKVVSIVHSSYPCLPARCSDKVVTLTKYWHDKLMLGHNIESEIIPGCIEVDRNNTIDYSMKTFGRISRNAPGKFHDNWNESIFNIIKSIPDAEAYIITENNTKLLKGQMIHYITDIKINEIERRKEALRNISIGIIAHGDFEEIFPIGVLEMMALGIPIVYLFQPSMAEMIGDSQICVRKMVDLEKEVIALLNDEKRKKELGRKAQIRANEFTIGKMQSAYNKIIQELMWK